MPSPFEFRIFFLEVCGIQEYNLSYLRSSFGTINLSPETGTNQFRQQATVVYMGMGQENRIQCMGWNEKRLPVPALELPFLV